MIGRLDLDLLERADVVVHRHMEAVRVVVAIGHTGDGAVARAVHAHEAPGQALSGRGDERVVHAALARHAVHVVAHVPHDLQAQVLRGLRLAVMLAGERHQRLGQSDEAGGERAVLEHLALLVGGRKLLRIDPHALPHQERRVVHLLAGLDLEALVELPHHERQLRIEQVEEQIKVALRADGQTRQIDGRERQVAAAGRDLAIGVEHVAHHARAAAHVGDLRLGRALVVLRVERRVQEAEVGEQPLGRAVHGQLEQVVVRILGVVVHAFLHAEDLHGEDGRLA